MVVCQVRSTPWSVIYSFVGRFKSDDRRRLVLRGGEELRPDDCVPWELHNSASIIRVLWELPDSV